MRSTASEAARNTDRLYYMRRLLRERQRRSMPWATSANSTSGPSSRPPLIFYLSEVACSTDRLCCRRRWPVPWTAFAIYLSEGA